MDNDICQEAQPSPPPLKPVQHTGFLELFIPKGRFFVTPVIVAINIIVFIVTVRSGVDLFSPAPWDLLPWGANFKPLVLGGEWWRLLACMFLHSGLFHLSVNMYTLLFAGIYLEPWLGRWRFITAYLATGLLSSIVSNWWHNDFAISVGASGAIFGMYGVFLALLTTDIVERSARQLVLLIVPVFLGFILFRGLSHREIDNAAHMAGLASGFVIGYIYYFSLKQPLGKKSRRISFAIAMATLLIALVYVGAGRRNDDNKFEQQFARFIDIQQVAEAPLQTEGKDNFIIPDILQQLHDISLPAWKRAQRMIDSTNTLHLSPAYDRKRQLVAQYIQLRLQHTALLLNLFDDSAGNVAEKFKEQAEALKAKIKQVQEEMNR